ncbi:MAG: hypothetical protein HY282_10055 [Nitrospirae bacterium]|nr:hypothetical protein [Candidatus Manganitrophaceae bacterium]
MRRSLFKRKKKERAEGALLSFKLGYINLMITLVPFLLSIAVFSRLAILQLNLPKLDVPADEVSLQAPGAPRSTPFAPTVAIEEEGIVVSNGAERIAFVKHRPPGPADGAGAPDVAALSAVMQELKRAHPEAKEVVLLSLPKTLYADLVAVMDACRSIKPGKLGKPSNPGTTDNTDAGRAKGFEPLFPDVSLGEVS